MSIRSMTAGRYEEIRRATSSMCWALVYPMRKLSWNRSAESSPTSSMGFSRIRLKPLALTPRASCIRSRCTARQAGRPTNTTRGIAKKGCNAGVYA